MKNSDKYLILIVVGVMALVAVAFSVALMRPKPDYMPEDSPQGIAYNYIFAIQQEDDARAYGYLSHTITNYPASVKIFTDDIRTNSWSFHRDGSQSPSFSIDSVKINKDHATVTMKKSSFYGGGLFSNGEYQSTFTMRLVQNASGVWKIEASEDYWAWRWDVNSRQMISPPAAHN